ncbi:MAG: rRNA (guanine-N1)-methyltransferase, partial [Shewanella sp.]
MGIASGTFSYADETELYVFESSARTGVRPKVLIIFDNSGSMQTLEQNSAEAYNPDKTYEAVGSANSYQGRMLYFTKGGIDNTSLPTPDSPSESRRFLDAINGCAESREALQKLGRFTGYLREYSTKGQTGEWLEFPDNKGANIELIDCWEDIEAKNPNNAPGTKDGAGAVAKGYPVDAKKSGKDPVAYNFLSATSEATALAEAKNTRFGTGLPVTLYTDNYLRWYTLVQQGKIPNAPKTRLEIAKSEITNFINSNTSVDFGLAVFNLDYPNEGDRDGGRIVAGIRQMTPTVKNSLMDTIEDLPADTNTPLCETLYEAYNYFGGNSIVYGNKDSDYNFGGGKKYTANKPPLDASIISGGKYISPLRVCPDRAYVIYITDGVPTVDQHADAAIKTLTTGASTAGNYSVYKDSANNFKDSYLPAMASYMFNNDLVNKQDAT